ncbi:reverse transcriptase domain-containing protein [Tanacetum coccineum]|uniref:Reverse transcriptase domain-containing protein n=1 Tax=Tanacetum coccineum TaxID=301880 RepID=A0ABQ5AYP6_9ASTR
MRSQISSKGSMNAFYESWDRFNDLLRACPHHGFSELHQLDTFYNALNINDQDSLNSAAGGNFLDKMPRECLKIIESKSKVRQTRAKAVVAKVSTNSSTQAVSSDVAELKDIVRALLLDKKNQASAPVKAVELSCVTTCGGAHSHQNCPATHGNVYRDNISEYVSQAAAANYNQVSSNFRPQMVANHIRPPGFPPVQNSQANNANNFNRGNNFNQNRESNFNQKQSGNLTIQFQVRINFHRPQGITTRSGVAYQGPPIPTSSVVKPIPEVTKDQVHPSCSQSTAPVQPPVGPEPITTPVFEPIVAPVVAPVPNTKPSVSLPYPSRRDNEKSRNQANEQIDKFYEIFKEMSFEISFTDALVLMPKFASTLRTLLGNKEKLTEVARTSNEPCLARTSMNEHCSAVIEQVTQKTWRPRQVPDSFLLKSFIPDLTPTCMTLELADRSISKPMGIAKDISVKVSVFHFPADFVVVDFEPDPRVPLILGRCFLKTSRALIDVHKGELTLRIGSEAITYNLDQTSRYSANYTHMTANKIDVIDMACEEYSQEVLGFTDIIASGNSTPYDDPIVATSSPTLTPFGDSDFLLLEEVDSFLGLADDPDCPAYNPFYYDPEGDILILEAILNSEPPPPLPNHKQYMPGGRKELELCEAKTIEPSVHEPPEVELKELPPHLEYAFLEGDNKLPVIIAKELDVEEKSALVKTMEVFMDDFSVFRSKMAIVHAIRFLRKGIEYEQTKIDVIAKLPHPTTVKGIRSFSVIARLLPRFIQDFSKYPDPKTHLLEKNTPFIFPDYCIRASKH